MTHSTSWVRIFMIAIMTTVFVVSVGVWCHDANVVEIAAKDPTNGEPSTTARLARIADAAIAEPSTTLAILANYRGSIRVPPSDTGKPKAASPSAAGQPTIKPTSKKSPENEARCQAAPALPETHFSDRQSFVAKKRNQPPISFADLSSTATFDVSIASHKVDDDDDPRQRDDSSPAPTDDAIRLKKPQLSNAATDSPPSVPPPVATPIELNDASGTSPDAPLEEPEPRRAPPSTRLARHSPFRQAPKITTNPKKLDQAQ